MFARAQTRYSRLRLLAACGRRGCDAARGDRGRRNAANIDLRHRQIEEAQDGIGQLIVAAEAAAQPMAPIGHAAAGVQLEGRLTAIERRRDGASAPPRDPNYQEAEMAYERLDEALRQLKTDREREGGVLPVRP